VVLVEDVSLFVLMPETTADLPRQVQLVREPPWHRASKRAEPGRGGAQIGFKDALELEQRLVIEAYVVELTRLQPGLA
jgi:hypothetical protein